MAESLARREREAVRKEMIKEALDKCQDTRAAYVDCARGRTFSIPFMCRSLFLEFNSCLGQYTKEEELDRRVKEAKFERSTEVHDIREGFRGDLFGTGKERAMQYKRQEEAELARMKAEAAKARAAQAPP